MLGAGGLSRVFASDREVTEGLRWWHNMNKTIPRMEHAREWRRPIRSAADDCSSLHPALRHHAGAR